MDFVKLKESKWIFLIVLCISFVIRISLSLYDYENEVWLQFADDKLREEFAETILEKGFVYEITDYYSSDTILAPLVPIVISLTKLLLGNSWSWLIIFFINSLIGAFSCVLIYLISKQFFNSSVSFIAFIWAAFYPAFIRYIPTAGNEPWIVFLFLLTFWLLLKTIDKKKIYYKTILAALSFTLLFHTDERYIAYYLLIVCFFTFVKSNNIVKFRKIFIFSSFLILFSTPWFIRNYLAYKDVEVITVRTTSLTKKIFNHRDELIFNHINPKDDLTISQIDSIKKDLLLTYPDGRPFEEGQVESMKSGIIPHDFNKIESFKSRLYFLWLPIKFKENYRIGGYCYEGKWSVRHNLLTGLTYGLLLPFVLFALFFLIKKRKFLVFWLFTGILIYHTFIHVAFIPYTRDRYRHPIDFIVIILGCYGIYMFSTFMQNKSEKIVGTKSAL